MSTDDDNDNDNEWSGFSQTMRQASQARRADNRNNSAELLKSSGIAFQSRNDGAHLIVSHGRGTINFWPGTGKWIVPGSQAHRRGVHSLIKFIKEAS